MSFQPDRTSFYQVIFGAMITIGGVFLAVSFALGIETIKADGRDVVFFNTFFWFYLIVGAVAIVAGLFGASIRFLGWPRPPRN